MKQKNPHFTYMASIIIHCIKMKLQMAVVLWFCASFDHFSHCDPNKLYLEQIYPQCSIQSAKGIFLLM